MAQVYTSYQFYVQACTTAGCSSGPTVSLTTAQMPPTLVEAPSLQILGKRSVSFWRRVKNKHKQNKQM